jgi:outer membrane receptor protein involved in Fe transport
MKKLRVLLILPILITFAQLIFPQSSGKIAGKVTDKLTGEAIPMANVVVDGTSLGAAADVEGKYVILNVPSGVYSVTASVVGYQKLSINNVRVNVDFTTRLDFAISEGAIDLPAVIIQGERNPLIRQDLTNPTVAINTETIQELPVDQISDVIRLQAGVVTGNDGTLHVRGGRSNEIAFTLNGVSLNDPYGNFSSIGIATNAVQEVSVSTGTFSAQYGNALSGVVNYVTKEGGDKYSFSIKGYLGDYFTNRKNLFPHIEDIDPLNRGRLEATFGGPIPELPDAKIYLSSVMENFKGSLYGIRIYNPTDSYLSPENFSSTDPRKGTSSGKYYFNPYYGYNKGTGLPTGDSSWVGMNPSTSLNIQGNLSYRFSPTIKLKYEVVYDWGESKGYSMSYFYNPDGVGKNYSRGLMQALDFTHTVSENLFYTLKISNGYNISKYYLYENFDDPRYLPSAIFSRSISNTTFLSGGTDNYREYRRTGTIGIKGDLVTQLFKIHEIKFGFEGRFHKLNYEGYSVEIGKQGSKPGELIALTNTDLLYDSSLTIIRRVPTSPSLYTNYQRKPSNFSFYLQDKIEFESSFIVNAGVRYEYFNPASTYNTSLSKNLIDSLFGFMNAYLQPAKIKHSLSPRISMSYPITDKAIIRLSYGHFYQIGSLSSLYSNNRYWVTNVGSVPTFGNPDVEPQKSIQYEIGLQQQLTEDMAVNLTGYYKDTRNYIYTQTIYTQTGREYNLLSNLAYANSRGVTISLLKRRSPGSMLSFSADYTFSISEGNRTLPTEDLFFSEQAGKTSETYLVPLSFDRSHVINGTVALTQPNDWNLGLIVSFETGTPYTPSLPSNLVQVRYYQNSDNQPINYNVDLKFEKYFKIDPIDLTVFLQVENIFDIENERFVYASSGRALSNIEQVQNPSEFNDIRTRIKRGDPGLFGIDQIDNYYSRRPERVSRPREIRLGFSLIFN